MIINQHFVDLLSTLTPTASEKTGYASHRTSIEAKLESSFNVTFTMETGSFRSGTGVRYHTDLDVLASIPSTYQKDNSYNMLLAIKKPYKNGMVKAEYTSEHHLWSVPLVGTRPLKSHLDIISIRLITAITFTKSQILMVIGKLQHRQHI